MKELITMLDRKYPGASKGKFFRKNAYKFTRNFNELQRLRNRRPEIYEAAVIALVDWIGKRSMEWDDPESRMHKNVVDASFWQDMGE